MKLLVLAVSLALVACAKPAPEHGDLIAVVCGDEVALGEHELRNAVAFMDAYEVDCEKHTATPRTGNAAERYERGTGVKP
jgi:hypothetical protein